MFSRIANPEKHPPIRVLVLEESSFRREGVQSMLQRYPDLDVIMVPHDPAESMRMAIRRQPDVVVVNLEADAVRIVRELHQRLPGARVVVMSPLGDAGNARSLRNAGANEVLFGIARSGAVVEAIIRQGHLLGAA